MELLFLYFLAIVDWAFIGFRSAAGRNALIFKKDYYRRAMVFGIIWGHVTGVLVILLIGIFFYFSPQRQILYDQFMIACSQTCYVFGVYAAILFVAMILRLFPSVDLRSIMSVLVFGPFTLIRPFVVITGITWAICSVYRWEVTATLGVILILMLTMESMLVNSYDSYIKNNMNN